ncbi:hypothetical protein PMAYCL1PPCAC_28508, partial [Pristionchus mayeri]
LPPVPPPAAVAAAPAPAARVVGVIPAQRNNPLLSGKIRSNPIPWESRKKMEEESRIIYPYPRFLGANDRRYDTHRNLDLIQDGEAPDGETVNDAIYHMDSVLVIDGQSALINWSHFMFPTWQRKNIVDNGPALQEHNKRVKMLDPIVKSVIMESETPLHALRKLYPNIVIIMTMDYNEYVKQPGIVYLSGLNKMERQINDFVDEKNGRPINDVGPTLIFEDWTSWQHSSIPIFEYLLDSVMSPAAAKINENLSSNTASCECTKSCDHRGNPKCCANKSATKVAYIKKKMLGNTVKPRDGDDEEEPEDAVDMYECGDACKCDKTKCMQRAVQLGRRIPLVVFMHPEKSWTVRAGCYITKGNFVCSYLGEMITAKEAAQRKDQMYQVDIKMKTTDGQYHNLVVDSLNMGNESRFIAHSCAPNLFTQRVHFEVEGRPKRHIALFANRDIEAGEELSFDYYHHYKDPVKFHNKIGFACKCGASTCREKAYQQMKRRSTT